LGTLLDILLVNTGNKYSEKYVDNIVYMLSNTGTRYDKIHVIRDEQYDGVWNKLQLFRDFKNGPYLYFDLDVCIKDNVEHLVRDNFTLLHAWWRTAHHTPLNSSIMSWKGDYSFYYNTFAANSDYYMLNYKGIDQYIYELDMVYETYDPVCTSYNWHGFDEKWPVIIFNQAGEKMLEDGPWSKYMQLG
jgi:hypothetical protein